MAQLKAEFLQHHYRGRLRPLRDYLFGYFGKTAEMLAVLSPLVPGMLRLPGVWRLACRLLGLAAERPLPEFVRGISGKQTAATVPSVLMLQDPFSHYVEPVVEDAAVALLTAAGYQIRALSKPRSLAALISKGFLHAASREAHSILKELQRLDPQGVLPLVVLEPPELEALRQDVASLLPGLSDADAGRFLRACSVEQLLVESGTIASLKQDTTVGRVLLHPHCHEKAGRDSVPGGADYDEVTLLRHCGYEVDLVDAGCCGMGGTFGFEAEHYGLSQKIGDLKLFPAIKAAGDSQVVATGGACRMHITQGTQRKAEHPLVLAARALGLT
jgi:Fe-S oxidoreductase